jgi:hypothetical protein
MVLDQYGTGAFDWVQLVFPDDVLVDVIVSRAWYKKVALTLQAPRSVKLRKTEAPG